MIRPNHHHRHYSIRTFVWAAALTVAALDAALLVALAGMALQSWR